MRHIIFEENENNEYPVCILIKTGALKRKELLDNYVSNLSIPDDEIIGFSLKYNDKGKCPVSFIKGYLASLLPALTSLNTKHLYVCDTAYFKVLANVRTAEPHYGYALPCAIKGFESMKVVLGVSYPALFYKPDLQSRLDLTLDTLHKCANGIVIDLGNNVIHSSNYPELIPNIVRALDGLHKYPAITCDVETNSLSVTTAGLETIAFAWDQHNGLSFCVDRDASIDKSRIVRSVVKKFLEAYEGTLIFQNANFDLKILIYELWMSDPSDVEGMLEGIECLTKNIEDTKIITYLATNSTSGNKLDLKSNSHEFMGNYGVF